MLKKPSTLFFTNLVRRTIFLFNYQIFTINNCKIKPEESIKIIGVLLDANVTWKEHLKYIENKCAKNIGLLYKVKYHLYKKCLLALYVSYVHTYMKYANIAWVSIHFTNLKKLRSKQKHAMRIVHNKAKFEHTRHFFRKNKILNVYQLNILNNVMFVQRISTKTLFHQCFIHASKDHLILILLTFQNLITRYLPTT